MIETISITYSGAQLEIPAFLADLWPYDLPLGKWPTFCGSGDGIGDLCIPDSWYLGMVHLSPACFVHDICWAMCETTQADFELANGMFLRNLKALVDAQLYWPMNKIAYGRCEAYYAAVSTAGHLFFAHDYVTGQDPFENETVRARLHRLARVVYDIPGYIDGERHA